MTPYQQALQVQLQARWKGEIDKEGWWGKRAYAQGLAVGCISGWKNTLTEIAEMSAQTAGDYVVMPRELADHLIANLAAQEELLEKLFGTKSS